jgi:hypothetical protein
MPNGMNPDRFKRPPITYGGKRLHEERQQKPELLTLLWRWMTSSKKSTASLPKAPLSLPAPIDRKVASKPEEGWVTEQKQHRTHVYPPEDFIQHDVVSPGDCICGVTPRFGDGQIVYEHHSLDGREFEKGTAHFEPHKSSLPDIG